MWYNISMKKIFLTLFLIFATILGVNAQANESAIQIFFLSPLKQKKPQNTCKTDACKVLLKNIKEAQDSIDFAIYGINEQDKIFNALVNAQKRGVKVRWVTDLNERKRNIYYDTYMCSTRLSRWLSGNESTCQRRRRGFDPWIRKSPWRRKWQPTPVLSEKSHEQRSLASCSPWSLRHN